MLLCSALPGLLGVSGRFFLWMIVVVELAVRRRSRVRAVSWMGRWTWRLGTFITGVRDG